MSKNAHDAPMHGNNRAAFLSRQVESESARAITVRLIVLLTVIKSFFGVFPGHVVSCDVGQFVMCSARLSMAPISYKYAVPARL
jgi:hypothetical protein